MATNARAKVRRAIHNIFTKKYGLHLQIEATKYLEDLLISEFNVADTLERIIKAYKKRYSGKKFLQLGNLPDQHSNVFNHIDKQIVIVNEATIKEVIIMMQSTAVTAASLTHSQHRGDTGEEADTINDSLQDMSIDEYGQSQNYNQSQIDIIDVTQQFHVVDAFDMPRMLYDEHTRTFNR